MTQPETGTIFAYNFRLPSLSSMNSISSNFERAANGRFIRECNLDLPINDLGPPNRSRAYRLNIRKSRPIDQPGRERV